MAEAAPSLNSKVIDLEVGLTQTELESLGQILRQHRLKASMLQGELAEKIGYNTSTILQIETDEILPSKDFLYRFIDLMNLGENERNELNNLYQQLARYLEVLPSSDATQNKGINDQSTDIKMLYQKAEAQLERRLEQLTAFREIDTAISASFDLRATFQLLLKTAIDQLKADAATLFVFDLPNNSLEFAAQNGFRSKGFQDISIRLGEGNIGKSVLERRTISLDDLSKSKNEKSTVLMVYDEEAFSSAQYCPLIAKGEIKGVLSVFNRKQLKQGNEFKEFLETLAGQAAIAIDNVQLFDNIQRSNLELALAYDATLEGWVRAMDLRDKESEGHTLRITEMSVRFARQLGINDRELIHIRRGALLHDIGKMGIPDHILFKPASLTKEEWAVMRKHPEYAFEMLYPIIFLRPALDIPYCHHEHWDGSGYPRGLKGEQIPLAARLFTIVDVWDNLRSNRPYRSEWSSKKVKDFLIENSGKMFDPSLINVFLDLVDKEVVGLPKKPSTKTEPLDDR